MASLSRISTLLKHSNRARLRPQTLSVVPWSHLAVEESSFVTGSAGSTRWLSSKNKKKTKTKKSSVDGRASSGRVAVYQEGESGRSKSVKLCAGCGCQILKGGQGATHMLGGAEAADHQADLSKRQAKQSRYMDVTDTPSQQSLCHRCKALQSNNIWKAYDALRDVQPKVFLNQLKFVVSRRRYGMGIVVLDATDSEHSLVKNLRDAVGKTPLICVWNKVDLLPRLDRYDQRNLDQLVRNYRFIASFAVSAKTGQGVAALAEYLLENLGGRDIFCLGAANVGKSTLVKSLAELIASSGIYFKGFSKQAHKRREQVSSSLKVTGSHLPGTTLQAVRIPCFGSKNHALWDTPGIINSRALQYNLFPAHLMEPLTRPGAIEVPRRDNGKVGRLTPGMTLLIESTWMSGDRNDEEDHEEEERTDKANNSQGEECVLARIDLLSIDPFDGDTRSRDTVFCEAYLHPSLRVRAVPTSEAPDTATIPKSHIERIQQKIQGSSGQRETGLSDSYSLPLKAFIVKERPQGEIRPGPKEQGSNGKHYMDIVFPSLGWIALINDPCFTVVPHCVKGSIFSKRKSLYPVGMLPVADQVDYLRTDESLEEQQQRLKEAAKRGRHLSNRYRDHDGDCYDDGEEDLSDWY